MAGRTPLRSPPLTGIMNRLKLQSSVHGAIALRPLNEGGIQVGITRREMLKSTGLVLGGLALPGVVESCLTSSPSSTPSGTIKIGFVSPITGPAAGFG